MKTTAEIYNCGYQNFWTEVMKLLDVYIYISLDSHLLERDKIKFRNMISEHDHAHMAKIKDKDHAKIRTELEKRFKNITKNMEYGSHIGCKEGDGKSDEKKEGVRRKKEEE